MIFTWNFGVLTLFFTKRLSIYYVYHYHSTFNLVNQVNPSHFPKFSMRTNTFMTYPDGKLQLLSMFDSPLSTLCHPHAGKKASIPQQLLVYKCKGWVLKAKTQLGTRKLTSLLHAKTRILSLTKLLLRETQKVYQWLL